MTGKRLRRAAVGQAPDRSECDRILVVDDDRAVRSVLTRLLTADGYEVATAGNAREALTLLAGYEFALLLSDINMPGGSGIELIRAVAAAYPEVAAVMMTGVDAPHLAAEAVELGAYGYVLKPFERLEIEIQVAEALQRRRLERGARSRNAELERLVAEVASRHPGATAAQVALAWLVAQGTVPIPGTRNSARLEENVGSLALQLSDDDGQRLDDVGQAAGDRYPGGRNPDWVSPPLPA